MRTRSNIRELINDLEEMSHTDSESKTKDDVYRERNLLAIAYIAALGLLYIHRSDEEPRIGWWPDTDDANGEEWAVVWADTAAGQVGWHVPLEIVPEWLEKRDPEYDGYLTAEKNARMEELIYE